MICFYFTSGKHSSSTSETHSRDFKRIMDLEEFDNITKTEDSKTKPVVILLVDGGPDENPRYPKNINAAISHFRRYDLDAIFIATNAPGRSAFNPVERRMAPLSRQLSGVILPHEHFGSHLDQSGKTIDKDLEKKNFEYAGQVLAEIFCDTFIDNHVVIAEYVAENEVLSDTSNDEVSEEWKFRHVRSSQYFLQIVKCEDIKCCSKPRSCYFTFFPTRFLSAPIPLKYQPKMSVTQPESSNIKYASLFQGQLINGKVEIPYDKNCPSQSKTINERVCIDCGYYCASIELLKKHRKSLHNRIVNTKKKPKKVIAKRKNELMIETDSDVEWIDKQDVDVPIENIMEKDNDVDFENIISMQSHLQQPWENE